MNTEVELEDVSNSKKDGENDACTASTIDNPGGGSGDAIVDSNSNSDNPIKEQQPVFIDNTTITEALPPEKKVINIEVHQIESTKADDQYPVIDSEVLDEELLLNSDDETNEVDKKEIDDAVRNIEGTNLDKSDEKATKIKIPTSEDDPDSSFELIFDTEEKPKDDPGSDFELVYDSIQMPTEAPPADNNLKIIDQELGNIDATEIKAVETSQSEPSEQSKECDTKKLLEQKPEESTPVINSNNDTGTHTNNPGLMNEPESNDNQTDISGTHSENTKNIEPNKEIAAKTNIDTVAHEVRRSISLDWEDDDQQMQTDQSLSDDALKQLDAELGISDNINDMSTKPVIEPVEDSEEIIPSSDSKVDIPVVNSKEISLNSQDTEMVERNLENMSKNIPDDNAICNEKIKTNVPDSIHDDSNALKIPDISLGDADIKAETVDNTSLMDVDIAEIDSNQEMAIGTKIDKNAMEVDETSKMSLETPKENTEKCEENIASGEKCDKSIQAIAKLSEKTESPTGFNETITEDLTKDVQSTRKLTSSDNNTIGIKTDHKIKRPDVMIDIPTQELIDCDDEESSENLKSNDNECDRYSLTSKTVTEIVNHLAASKSPEKTDTLKEHQDTAEDQKEETGKEDEELQHTEEEKCTKNAESSKNEIASKPQDNIDKSKNVEDKLASNESQKIVIEPDDNKASEEKHEQTSFPTEIYVQPSTSKPEDGKASDASKTTPEEPNKTSEVIKTDDSEEAEDTDTLGLLAESSRVCDDDEEQEDIDGDAEYDDDVDPDDESSNPMTTAEHSEDSNTPETEPQETQASPDEERNFIKVSGGKDIEAIGETDKADDAVVDMILGTEDDATSLVSDSNDAIELNAEAMDTTDITIEENEPIVAKTTENETEDKEEDPNSLTVTEKLEEILNKSVNLDKSSKTRRRSILLELLSKIDNEDEALEAKIAKPSKVKKLEITPTKQVFYVDLDCDAEEDAKKDKKEVEEEASSDVTKETDDSNTSPKDEEDKAADSKNEEGGKEEKDDDVEEIVNVAEILNLDSDEEVIAEEVSIVKNNSCINNNCTSDESVQYYKADKASISYYCGAKRRGALICQCCLEFVETRNKGLIAGIKDMRDLMDLEMEGPGQLLVEISDSDSEDGQDSPDDEPIGEDDAKLLEDQLGELINSSWIKYKMDERVKEAEDYLQKELDKIQKQSKELDEILKDCEKTTDTIRTDFYATFEPNKHELPALNIYDTPIASYFCMEKDDHFNDKVGPSRQYKRQATTAIDTPAKKQALPTNKDAGVDQVKQDDDKDVSVVRLSAESAPLELPPPGEMTRAPLKLNMSVYAMKNSFGAWLPGKVIEITPQATGFTQCRIRFEHNMRNPCKVLPARCIAYTYPSEVRMTIGTRVVALFKNTDSSETKKESYYSGVVAEIPNPVNNYRYLVFFDDGYAQYVSHQHTRLVAESSAQVWEEVHPFSRDFVYNYLLKYPERPMVRMHKGQTISVELNGKWYETRVVKVDASLVQVLFIEEKRTEWIYRGSTRLRPLFVEFQAAKGGARTRLPRSTRNNAKTNMPYVEYTRSDEQVNKNTTQEGPQQTEELRRLRAVAKKSTGPTPVTAPVSTDGATSRVVYYTPKHCIRPHKLTPHTCGPRCRRTDVLSLAELRTYNPLAKPLLSGWERQITRVKGHRAVMYRAPCGRRVRSMAELHRYLAALRSDLAVDLFDFNPLTHCLAEFVLTKYNVGKKDLSHGKENVPVACVNYYDTSLPEFCSYNTERTPTAGVPLNLDPEFLCGCDCTDDCADKAKCACWQMTLEGARTIGMEGPNIGYQYRRLLEPLPTGIYECNSRCKCKNTCLNRVAQHPLQLKLQDGLNEGDEYLAELDYIEVVEAMKEGYEEDVVDPETKTVKKDSKASDSGSESDAGESEEEERANKSDKEDDDFQPGSIGLGLTEFSKRLRQRDKKKTKDDSTEDKDGKTKEDNQDKDKDKDKKDGDCITISDDEEVREPARFTAQEGMGDKKFVSKYKSIRDYFGKDEACYIMDAKVQGNIGRYLNHSCSPNVFVQNVFVDTHDPRFPWVSFFALHHIKAGTELTWNYNYDVGSVPGKVLYCFCGAYNCRGRLL